MNAQSEETISNFRNTAIKYFDPIAKLYGGKLVATGLTEYSIPLDGISLRIQLIPSHIPDLAVSFFSNDSKWLRESALSDWGVNLLKFVQYGNANFNFKDKRLSSRAEIGEKMAILSELLVTYCEPLLRGDLSLWGRVSSLVEKEVAEAGKLANNLKVE